MSQIRTIKPEWRTDQKLGKAGLAARALHGRARYERIWRRVERGEWGLREIVHLISRPRFASSGGSDEIVLVDLVRARVEQTRVRWR